MQYKRKFRSKKIYILLGIAIVLWISPLYAQESSKDKDSYIQNLLEIFIEDITNDSFNVHYASQEYELYKGKQINEILISVKPFHLSLKQVAIDEKIIENSNQFINKIHQFSRDKTIEKHLFFKRGDLINPILIAESERYLRSLEFIQDADITIQKANDDLVDVYIVISDLFTYAPFIGYFVPSEQLVGLSNINLLGSGHQFGIDVKHDKNRYNQWGTRFHGRFQNIKNSYIESDLLYSTIEKNLYNNLEDEQEISFSAQLPLVHIQRKWVGGIKLVYRKSLDLFEDKFQTGIHPYQYLYGDFWIGYNLSNKNLLNKRSQKDFKKLLAVRYFNYNFIKEPLDIRPNYVGDSRFLDRQGVVLSMTLFKQQYFKSQYIYGFGRTEDIPTGHNIKFTAGYYDQRVAHRAYIGLEYYRYKIAASGDLFNVFFKSSGYFRSGSGEDLGIMAGISSYLKLKEIGRLKLRNYYRLTYTQLFKYRLQSPLYINNDFGIYGIESELAQGLGRLAFRSEHYFFLPYQLYGFSFAPILIGDMSLLYQSIPNTQVAQKNGFFYAIGAGLRIKNEQLGLNTIELRTSFIPKQLIGNQWFYFSLITNLNFSRTNKYVHPPDFIDYNNDINKLSF